MWAPISRLVGLASTGGVFTSSRSMRACRGRWTILSSKGRGASLVATGRLPKLRYAAIPSGTSSKPINRPRRNLIIFYPFVFCAANRVSYSFPDQWDKKSCTIRPRAGYSSGRNALILTRTVKVIFFAEWRQAVEAFRFMHHSKRFGCHVYPLLFLITLAAPGLIGQNSTGSGSPAPAQTQTEENPQQNQ